MIYLVKRNQLDEKKYNDCISKSIQTRIYAYSWYLDVVADHWSALILDDYEAVMPLPWKRKYGLAYITQPFFTQQLGLFSKEELREDTIAHFLKHIPKRFLKIALQFNSQNFFHSSILAKKTNYLLSLNAKYNSLYKGFSKGRKHAIQQGLKNKFDIEEIRFSELLLLSKNNYSLKEIPNKEFDKLIRLVAVLQSKNLTKIIGIKVNDVLIGGSVFVIDSHRVIYLFSAVSKAGKEKQVASLLLHEIIKKHSSTNRILDFEGSMIPSIASFFKSFGAAPETYFLLKKWLL